jgi:hypothetical protein
MFEVRGVGGELSRNLARRRVRCRPPPLALWGPGRNRPHAAGRPTIYIPALGGRWSDLGGAGRGIGLRVPSDAVAPSAGSAYLRAPAEAVILRTPEPELRDETDPDRRECSRTGCRGERCRSGCSVDTDPIHPDDHHYSNDGDLRCADSW